MPKYDYRCDKCGVIEVEQSIVENPLTKCPNCGSINFNKIVSGIGGVIFKGSGFYETDYKIKKGEKERDKI